MSAVLEKLDPVVEARAVLDAARAELAALDERIAGFQRELDEREVEQARYRAATVSAVSAGKPLPKPLKVKPSDAEVALPILRGQRAALGKRIEDCEGLLRRALVEEVVRRKHEALAAFAEVSTRQIAAWRELLALQGLLDQAGVRGEPLPGSLYSDFSIPAFGVLRPICENHSLHFLASHALAPQGELLRMTHAVRVAIEAELGERLPW